MSKEPIWQVVSWTHNETKARTAYTVTTATTTKGARLDGELITFRVLTPHDDAIQQKRAKDYCFYLNLLEERSEEVTITGAVAQRLLKEEQK